MSDGVSDANRYLRCYHTVTLSYMAATIVLSSYETLQTAGAAASCAPDVALKKKFHSACTRSRKSTTKFWCQ